MNIAEQLPQPLRDFVVDVPANQYYDFELSPGSTYPLKGVTYPVDYGNIPGYTAEDAHELDFFVGKAVDGEAGSLVVDRGSSIGYERKFYVGLTKEELALVLKELEPVLVDHQELSDVDAVLAAIEPYKDKA